MQTLYLVRHGATLWSLSGKHTGNTDLPLAPQGVEEAKKLKEPLSKVHFSHQFSSPLKRATSTAELTGFSPKIDPLLVEWDYGKYEGKTSEEVWKERPHWNLFRDGAPEGETLLDIALRAKQFLAKIDSLEGSIVIFSSGHFLKVLAALWLEQDPILGSCLSLSSGSISVLGLDKRSKVILKWNQK